MRIITAVYQHQAKYVARAVHIHHRQCEGAGSSRRVHRGGTTRRGISRPISVFAIERLRRAVFATHIYGLLGQRIARRIDASGELSVDLIKLGIAQTALEIMVAIGHRPRDAPRCQGSGELADGLAHQFARVAQCRLRNRLFAPTAFAEALGKSRIIAGNLVAGKNHYIGASGIKTGFDQRHRIFGYLGTVLDIGNLQHAKLTGMMELQTPQTRGNGNRAMVPHLGRLDSGLGEQALWRTLCFRHDLHCTHKRKGPPERAFSTSSTTGAESLHNIIVATVSLSNARPT